MGDSKKYNSILRSYTVRNIYEDAALTPGTDVVIPAGNFILTNRTVINFSADTNVETNYMVRRAGVFSNFADGLIFKNPADRIDIDLWFEAYRLSGNPFVLVAAYGSRAVTTLGGDGWVAGNRYLIRRPDNSTMYVFATGAGAGNLEDYWPFTGNSSVYNLAAVASGYGYSFRHVSALNCMYEVNEFAQPFQFASNLDYDIVALHCGVNIQVPHTTTFMTDIIDTAFTDKTVFFDIVTEVEFTK